MVVLTPQSLSGQRREHRICDPPQVGLRTRTDNPRSTLSVAVSGPWSMAMARKFTTVNTSRHGKDIICEGDSNPKGLSLGNIQVRRIISGHPRPKKYTRIYLNVYIYTKIPSLYIEKLGVLTQELKTWKPMLTGADSGRN